MPIDEQSTKEYFEARDVFVESYKDFLRKLLGLLDETEKSTEDAEVLNDVVNFAEEVKLLKQKIDDFQDEEERANKIRLASSEAIPADATDESRSSEKAEPYPNSTTMATTTTSEKTLQKSLSPESAEDLQAELESAMSRLTPSEESIDETPQVLAPAMDDDGRIVSAFCAFRYHKAEFRQIFMPQGNNSAAAMSAANATRIAAISDSTTICEELLDGETPVPPSWLAPLAHYTLHLMRRAFRTATPEQWEALKGQLAGFGFKAEEHFALWLRLSATAPQDGAANGDPARVFNAIPPLPGLPKRLAAETKIMLQTLNLLSE